MAGCSASGRTPARSAGASTARPCAPEVWKVSWPARQAPVSARPATRPAQGVVGDGEDHEVGGGDDLVGGQQRDAGQQAGGALGGGGGEAGGGDDVVAGGGERGAQDGADPAGADDAHAEAGGRGGGGGSPAARTVLRGAGIGAPLVPVPVGYRTSVAAPTVVRPPGRAVCCRAVVLLLASSRCNRMCRAGRSPMASVGPVPRPPQRLGAVAWLTRAPRAPRPGSRRRPTVTRTTRRRRRGGSVGTMDGRTALVTGGSRGIGLAIAQSLVDRGARVVLTARKPDALAEAVESLGGPEVAVAVPGPRRRRRAPGGGGPDGGRDLRQPGHAGRQRRREPGLRARWSTSTSTPSARSSTPTSSPPSAWCRRRGGRGWPSTAARCCSSRRWPGCGRRRTSAPTASARPRSST